MSDNLEKLKATSKIDIPKLKQTPWLYNVVHYYLGTDGEVDLQKIPIDIAVRLDAWLELNGPGIAKQPKHQEQPKQEEKSEPERFREETAALMQRESKRLQTERDLKAALARLQQYADEQGLADTEENVALVTNWIDKTVKGYWSEKAVDVAIDILGPRGKNILTWVKVKSAPSLPPAEPVRLLDNGQPELPLNATDSQMYSASKEQLRDLSKRRGEGRQPHLGRLTGRF
jgi:hypothetical protein